jgi:alkylation response protein AidB-like acyl-CoA dehydrogenase
MTAMDVDAIADRVRKVSAQFAAERAERLHRRSLDPADFARLADAGFLLAAVPVAQGGTWVDLARTTRPVCEMLRTLAHGDPAVALVAAMHPSVLSFWLATPEAPPPFREAWQAQRREIFAAVRHGAWWGTITSEPGSGGDLGRTRAVARPAPSGGGYLVTGQKQFGSGSGVTSFMITTAVPDGEAAPDLFVLDMRGRPWDGSAGVTLVAPWDGHGMAATQSHAMAFADLPATRSAWPGSVLALYQATGGLLSCAFTAVIVGVVEVAIASAREQVARRRDGLRAYERVEWTRAELEGWLVQQAWAGMLRSVEEGRASWRQTTQGKTAIAELAESATGRICRVIGGGTFSRSSPFGCWHEDVRALGFLRPPWGLAYDTLLDLSLEGTG